jgi:hypothetical protein
MFIQMFFRMLIWPLFDHGPKACWQFLKRMTVGDRREKQGFEVKLTAHERGAGNVGDNQGNART